MKAAVLLLWISISSLFCYSDMCLMKKKMVHKPLLELECASVFG